MEEKGLWGTTETGSVTDGLPSSGDRYTSGISGPAGREQVK